MDQKEVTMWRREEKVLQVEERKWRDAREGQHGWMRKETRVLAWEKDASLAQSDSRG